MLFEPSLKDNIIVASKRAGAKEIPEGFTPVLIDRTTWLGNPFGGHGREQSLKMHKDWFEGLDSHHRIKLELRRLVRRIKKGEKIALVCWCSPKPCHGKVYQDYIQGKL